MPNWQPNWNDVHFDYQAAYTAMANCYGCIAFMESRGHALAPVRSAATREWRGRYRQEFDAESARLDRIAADVISQLHAAAHGIQREIEAAEAEQRFRVAERTRWEAELRAEHARAEHARAALARQSPENASGGRGATEAQRSSAQSAHGEGVVVLS